MNEGHAALLTLELLGDEAQKAGRSSFRGEDIQKFATNACSPPTRRFPPGMTAFPWNLSPGYFREDGFSGLERYPSADLMKRALQVDQNFRDCRRRPGRVLR